MSSIRVILLCVVLTLFAGIIQAQDGGTVFHEQLDTIKCCKILLKKGVDDYASVCCSDPIIAVAHACAKNAAEPLIGSGYTPIQETHQDPCTERRCPAAPSEFLKQSSPQPRVEVILNCCGCNGVFFRPHGFGANYCEALEDALATACTVVESQNMGGLKSWCVAQPAAPCKPKHFLPRWFRR